MMLGLAAERDRHVSLSHISPFRSWTSFRQRMDPIRRSTYGFCQGDLGAVRT